MNGISRSAWVATATVEPSPSHAVCCGVSVPLSRGRRPGDDQERQEHEDRHEVVRDRRVHGRGEPAPGVEHLGHQGEHPVEEDLGQAEAGEGHRQGHLVGGVVRRGVDPGEQRGQHHGDRGEREQQDAGQRQQPVGESGPAVGVLAAAAHELGDEHGVHRPAHCEHVHGVRDGVADGEDVGDDPQAEGGGHRDVAEQPSDPADHRADGHLRALGHQVALLGSGRLLGRVARRVGIGGAGEVRDVQRLPRERRPQARRRSRPARDRGGRQSRGTLIRRRHLPTREPRRPGPGPRQARAPACPGGRARGRAGAGGRGGRHGPPRPAARAPSATWTSTRAALA